MCISRLGPALTSTMAPPAHRAVWKCLTDQIDACDVEADHPGGQRNDLGGVGMHFVGTVEGVVGVALDQHFAVLGRHAVGVQPLAFQFHLAAVSMRMIDSG
jgi:hypothetical protein